MLSGPEEINLGLQCRDRCTTAYYANEQNPSGFHQDLPVQVGPGLFEHG